MYCKHCGIKQDNDSKFCVECGRLINHSQNGPEDDQRKSNGNIHNPLKDQDDDLYFQGEIEYHDDEEHHIYYGKGFTDELLSDSDYLDAPEILMDDTLMDDTLMDDTLIDNYKEAVPKTKKKPEDKKRSIILIASVLLIFLLVIVSIAIIHTQLLGRDVTRVASSYNGENELYSKEGGEVDYDGSPGDHQVQEGAGRRLPFNMIAIDDIISARTNPGNVSVAVLDLNSREVFATANGEVPFVASGFYIPLYLVALEHQQSLQDVANTMMSQMNNHSANEIIRAVGGFSQVNEVLNSLGFGQTTFAREFGDIDASERGFENYTTAKEAARMLEQIYDARQYFRMSVNLSQEGITLPNVANIYAHSGRGIGQTYNIFTVIHEVSGNYIVVIMTDNIGMAGVTPILSEILADIQRQME